MKSGVSIGVLDIGNGVKFVTVKRDGNNLFMSLMLSGIVAELQNKGITSTPNLYEDERGFLFEASLSDEEIISIVDEYCFIKRI